MEPLFLTHPLLELPGVAHGFFTREGGVSSGDYHSLNGGLGSKDDLKDVEANREIAVKALGGSGDEIRGLYQVHSGNALLANDIEARPEGDALVTNKSNLTLTILTADCAPILFADSEAGVIGAAHAGWRGAVRQIVPNTIALMEKIGASPKNIKAVIGPTIQQGSYQVGSDLRDEVLTASPWAEGYFAPDPKPNHYRFDLPNYILLQLERLNIEAAAMPDDTYSDARFFSHRRACHSENPKTGRLINMIRLCS